MLYRKKIAYVIGLIVSLGNGALSSPCPLNIVGHVNNQGSLVLHTSSLIDTLHDVAPITLIKTETCFIDGFAPCYRSILDSSIDLRNYYLLKSQKELSGVTIFTDFILGSAWNLYRPLAKKDDLRIAYSVTERTQLPIQWVIRLNHGFDAVMVPDPWLIDVFEKSGVTIPVFALPLVLDLQRLLTKTPKTKKSKPFVFGFSGTFIPRKNQLTLLQAFVEEFGSNPDVKLIIHGKSSRGFNEFFNACNKIKTDNVIISQVCLSRHNYEDFLASLSCYITTSKGEGFSIVPYEALAAGVPCIVSNNTAQTTLCNSGFVLPIAATIQEPSICLATGEVCGHDFGCTIKDVREALREMYERYEHYTQKTEQARAWVRGYTAQSLKQRYRTLVEPQRIILGPHNALTEEYLMTNSPPFFEKCASVFKAPTSVLCGLKK